MTAKEYLLSELDKIGLSSYLSIDGLYLTSIVDIMERYAKLKQAEPKQTVEQRKQNFADTIFPYVKEYGSEMCLQFFNYWSELNHSGKKMRFELQKTWEVGKRLATWQNNSKSFNNGKRNELNTLEQQLIAKFGG